MKKIIFLLLIIFLTGCTNYTDLNDLMIIKSIGLSFDNEYTLYVQVINTIDKDNNPSMKVIEIKDNSINNLFTKLKKEAGKKIYLSHIDLIVLDHNLKNNQYNELIYYILNNPLFRNDYLCILSDDIEEILKNSKYDEIEKHILNDNKNQKIKKKSFEKIIQDFLDYQSFTLSSYKYNDSIVFNGNYIFQNNKLERIKN